jgi:S1-C subfamily serine protease
MSTGDPFVHPRQSKHNSVWLPLALGLGLIAGLLLIGGGLVWHLWPWRGSGVDAEAEPRAVTPRGDLAEEEKSNIAIFRQASPSVVNITTLAVRQDVFGFDVQQIPKGTGSGIVWDDKGHIVTNFHVIQGADEARVTLADGSTWKARLVGAYPDKDMAVLVVDAPKDRLHKILIGTSGDLQVGQRVFAIGNPFGLDRTFSTGVISALGREIQSVTQRPITDMIQTDAAINPGNSGGPLLDSASRMIGMNTAILSPSGASVGIGLAIPVDEINRIVPQLIRHGKVVRPGLGVRIAADSLARNLHVKKGVLILEVLPDGPAAKAGLRATRRDANRLILGDIIVAIDKRQVDATNDLYAALENRKVDDTVSVTVLRDAEEQHFDVTLQGIQ